jgi:hypothetical protein
VFLTRYKPLPKAPAEEEEKSVEASGSRKRRKHAAAEEPNEVVPAKKARGRKKTEEVLVPEVETEENNGRSKINLRPRHQPPPVNDLRPTSPATVNATPAVSLTLFLNFQKICFSFWKKDNFKKI